MKRKNSVVWLVSALSVVSMLFVSARAPLDGYKKTCTGAITEQAAVTSRAQHTYQFTDSTSKGSPVCFVELSKQKQEQVNQQLALYEDTYGSDYPVQVYIKDLEQKLSMMVKMAPGSEAKAYLQQRRIDEVLLAVLNDARSMGLKKVSEVRNYLYTSEGEE